MFKQPKLPALNATMFILLALQVITGIRLWLVDLKGWADSTAWMNTHVIIGFSLVTLIAIHIYMNRRWIKAQLSGSK